MGKIDDGTTASDFDDEEIRRKISLYTSVVPVEYKDTKINFLDTPGYTDFVGEVISSMRVAEGVVLMVDRCQRPGSRYRDCHELLFKIQPSALLVDQQDGT